MSGTSDDGAKQTMVRLELNPASAVDVLGDPSKPLLVAGKPGEFTKAEAKQMLALTNEHGTPIVRNAQGANS